MYMLGKRSMSWEALSAAEKRKAQGYVRIAEYDTYYLYARVDKDNNVMYRECFSKFDIDGAKANYVQPKRRGTRHYKTNLD